MQAVDNPCMWAPLGVEDAAGVDIPSNANRPAGLRRQWLQGNAFEGVIVADEASGLDPGRYHRRDRRREPVLAQDCEGCPTLYAVDRGVLAQKETRALDQESAQQRNQYEHDEHLHHGQATNGRGIPGDLAIAIHGTGSRLFRYPGIRTRQLSSGRPAS